MNTWANLKSEAWRMFKKITWHNLKFDNLRDWLVHKTIRFRELETEYSHNLLNNEYACRELME